MEHGQQVTDELRRKVAVGEKHRRLQMLARKIMWERRLATDEEKETITRLRAEIRQIKTGGELP